MSTGRPNSYTYYTKKAAYHAYPIDSTTLIHITLTIYRYINSHYNSSLQLFAMYIIYRLFIDASGGILPMIVILLAASVSNEG